MRRPILSLTNNSGKSYVNRRRGAVMILMLLLLPVALLMAAFAVNIAYIELARTELVIATDAATRAGGRQLIATESQSTARTKARELAMLNPVAGTPLSLSDADLVFGRSIRPTGSQRYNFTATTTRPNALRVTAHRDAANADGPISLLMPNVVGRSSINSSQVAISTQMEVDVGLVVDRSGSMAYGASEASNPMLPPASAPPGWTFGQAAPPVSRWRDLVAAVDVFLNELSTSPGDEFVSLSSYSNSALTDTPLTNSYAFISAAMSVYTNNFPTGATNVGGGILEGAYTVRSSPSQRSGAAKVLIVMTDGMHNTGVDPVSAATSAAADGVMIFTVTFSDEADQTRMQQVAQLGNGRHFHASNAAQLQVVFQTIAQSLPTLLTQ